ncbi:hypothetical protein [Cellvibrio mixtus]|uniref:hypothetical protein n=1 Tax=Cellvibrio mixtus TaxID=39650 RepID=UPI001269BD3C|nr:hypothetical protein [Cellvibrio mixtus]
MVFLINEVVGMYFRWLVGIVFVLLLGGCKDVLNKPLEGQEDDLSRYVFVGNWVAEDKNIRLELKKTDKSGWYQFTVQEPERLVEGKVKVAGFKRKLAVSVEMASLRVNGEPLVRDDKQAYFLVGVYYDDDELRIAPADMGKFERNFSDYFFAVPIETAAFCIRGNENCKKTFTSGNLLVSKNRRKFNEDFVKHFRTVFPRSESIVFIPAS